MNDYDKTDLNSDINHDLKIKFFEHSSRLVYNKSADNSLRDYSNDYHF